MTAALVVLTDPRSSCNETFSPPAHYYNVPGSAGTGHWTITIPPFTWPGGTDGQFTEIDLVFVDPDDAYGRFFVQLGRNTPGATAIVTGGLTFDSSGALPAGIDFVGVVGGPMSAGWTPPFGLDGYVGDGTSTFFDIGFGMTFDAGTDASWLATPPAARPITVDVYEADNTTYAGTLGSDKGREWLDDLSAEGSYSVESLLDHADDALLTDGRVLRFSIDGTPRWPGLVEDRNIVLADPAGRMAGRTVAAAGRGLLAIFEDAAVLPELGFGLLSPDTRYFGWMSRYFDHSGWGNAVQLKQQNDPDPTKPWFGAPKNWTDTAAWWVGPTNGDVPGATPGGGTPGDIFFYGTYTVPVGEGGDYTFSITADDGFELYIDGNRTAAEQRVALWGETRPVPVQLDEGSHFIAVKLVNFDRPNPATNVVGLILSVAKMLGGGTSTGSVVTRSSSGSKMLAFPVSEPGMTAGHIVLSLIAENQASPMLWHPDLTCDFTATHDSAGVAWPVELNRSYAVASTVLEVLRDLTDSHAAEFTMDPVGKVLHAYVSKGTDRTPVGPGQVVVAYAVNVNRLKAQHVAPGKNSVISRTAEGRWTLTADAGAVASYGRRFVGLSLGSAPTDTSAAQQSTAYLADHAHPVEAITDLQVEDAAFHDGTVATGDLVVGPTSGGSATFRVHALRFTEDDAGQLIVTPEMVRQ